ncbi:alpha/beta hydrolase fold family protein [Burkholderia thailandensis MSMB121]|uniref:alpha/beta fold hydrolase n=1 Tax=Burkholderia humptydooensis TaxID=430531 RepID=UPI0003280ED5|nr:alpha/beta hydrolase [Burkholderia humptydooensis]AGK49770.1 alpha/beta hydrolase fold family protein [Burkholderia thailandensis MSMB121]ATF32646.1 alpha/beta hydrolase [Burkholderia thailandensis]KST71171.1 alpha/beta hydrolase [Burkholderia humptydooensis]
MRSHLLRRTFAALSAALWLCVAAAGAPADTHGYTAVAPDGVTLAIQESGDPDGSPIIFVHGLLGSRLNWDAQLKDPRLLRHRLITYDLRGHGLSGKPAGTGAYADGRRWADDLAAVIRSSHARKPVLVGWSLGAAVITNYLAAYGDGDIAGAVYVDGVIELAPDQIVAHPDVYRDMTSADLKTHLDGERAFVGRCFHRPPDRETFERLLANAALASWDMQRAVPSMTIPLAHGLGRARVPIWLVYGARDALVHAEPSIARAKAVNTRVRSTLYPDSGHAPFLEEPERFNRDLADFVDGVDGGDGGRCGGVAPTDMNCAAQRQP